MQEIWQNPSLRMLLIINIITLSLILIMLLILLISWASSSKRRHLSDNKDKESFKKYVERLKEFGVPREITDIFDELHEELEIIEENNSERINTYFALVTGLEEKIKLLQNATGVAEQKLIAVLQTIVAKLKKANRERVDKHADNLFKRLNRLEGEEIRSLEERLSVLETWMEASQIMRSPSVELAVINETKIEQK